MMLYLLVAIALPPATETPYCHNKRCDLVYYSTRTECEYRAMAEPVFDKMIFRCLRVVRREDPS